MTADYNHTLLNVSKMSPTEDVQQETTGILFVFSGNMYSLKNFEKEDDALILFLLIKV